MADVRMHPLWRAYDVMAALVLLPVVTVLALSLPDDLANYHGKTLRGTATAVEVSPFRGGTVATYQVRSSSGVVVGQTDDIYGLDAETVGESSEVTYVEPASAGYVTAYAIGEDPLWANAGILAASGSAFLIASGSVARRAWRLMTRRRATRVYGRSNP